MTRCLSAALLSAALLAPCAGRCGGFAGPRGAASAEAGQAAWNGAISAAIAQMGPDALSGLKLGSLSLLASPDGLTARPFAIRRLALRIGTVHPTLSPEAFLSARQERRVEMLAQAARVEERESNAFVDGIVARFESGSLADGDLERTLTWARDVLSEKAVFLSSRNAERLRRVLPNLEKAAVAARKARQGKVASSLTLTASALNKPIERADVLSGVTHEDNIVDAGVSPADASGILASSLQTAWDPRATQEKSVSEASHAVIDPAAASRRAASGKPAVWAGGLLSRLGLQLRAAFNAASITRGLPSFYTRVTRLAASLRDAVNEKRTFGPSLSAVPAAAGALGAAVSVPMAKLPVERGLPLIVAVLCALGAVLFLELLARRRRRLLADGAAAAPAASIPIKPTASLISEKPQPAPPAAAPPVSDPPAERKRAAPVIELGGRVEGLAGFGDPVTLPKGATVRIAVECGSTTAKTLVLDEAGNIVHGTYQKHHARVYEMSALLLESVLERFKDQEVVNIGFSGSAGQKVSEKLAGYIDLALEGRYGAEGKKGQVNIRYTNEVISQTAPILEQYGHLNKDTHIFEIGGEDSKYIHLGADGKLKKTALNGECAAGTGTFLEEQVARLGFDKLLAMIDGAWTAVDKMPPEIAGRCTVFAKTDITHLLRHENLPKELVAWGVHNTIVLTYLMNLVGEVKRGMAGDGIIIFQGGTSKNRVLVEAFKRLLQKKGIDPARLIVPDFPEIRIAQGAAMFAARNLAEGRMLDRSALVEGLAKLKDFVANRTVTSALPQLRLRDPRRLEKTWTPYQFKEGEVRDVFLGLDVGSTTTKFVLIDAKTEAVLHKDYVRTEGQPFAVMERGIHDIRDKLGSRIRILHVGVTGSGREAMGAMVGADAVVDEINAHATAVGRLHPDADTIIEIGGQDSKFMRVMKGMIEDFEMNKACAAGTGSFFDEAADRVLGVMVEELGDSALRAMSPADLGEVCTVFMKSRIVQAQAEGYTPEDISAGLAYSIAKNYLNKVKGGKAVGRKIVFQGGVSNNKAVVAALEALTGKPVEVPEHAEVMGAIGMALIAKTRYENKLADASLPEAAKLVATKFRGLSAGFIPTEVVKGKRCAACANQCQLMYLVTPEGKKLVYGPNCDLHDKSIPKELKRLSDNLPDLLHRRHELLTKDYLAGEAAPPSAKASLRERFTLWAKTLAAGGRPAPSAVPAAGIKTRDGRVIGFPAGLNFWENFPFWHAFFNAAGFEVVASRTSDKHILDLAKQHLNIDPCLPMKMLYGMVADLLQKEGVTDIFLPVLLELKPFNPASKHASPCPQVTGAPYALKGVFNPEEHGKRFLSPELDLSVPREEILEQFERFGAGIGLPRGEVRRAFDAAERAAEDFRKAQRAEGAKALSEMREQGQKGVVFLSRPYSSLDGGLNMGVPREVRKHGWQALPMDFLALEEGRRDPHMAADDTWYYQGKILQAAEIVADDPDLYPVYITPFRCGPDAYIIKKLEARCRAAGKPLLVLEIDEHTSAAGFKTRIDAYITSIKLANEAAQRTIEKAETAEAFAASGRPAPKPMEFLTLEELKGKKTFIPRMSDHIVVLAGALRAAGIDAEAFKPATDAALDEGRKYSNGKECLPYPVLMGEAIVGIREQIKAGTKPGDIAVMFYKSNGSCRFSQYTSALETSLREAGFPGLRVANLAGRSKSPAVPNHFVPSLRLTVNIWKSFLIGDYLHQLLLENRPYEIHTEDSARKKLEILAGGRQVLGDYMDQINASAPDYLRKVKLTELVYQKYLREAAEAMGNERKLLTTLERFVAEIRGVPQDRTQRKPLIGLVGEIYLRMNDYANGDIIRQLEAQGAEVFLAPFNEFVYNGLEFGSPLETMGWRDFFRFKGLKSLLGYFAGKGFLRLYDDKIYRVLRRGIQRKEFGRGRDVKNVIRHGVKHTGQFSSGEGPLTLGAMEEYALHGADGAIMIGPAGCLPNTIYEGLIQKMKNGLPPDKRDFPTLVVSMSESRNLKNVRTRTEALVYQAKEYMDPQSQAKGTR